MNNRDDYQTKGKTMTTEAELMTKETAQPAPIESAFADVLKAAQMQVEESRKLVVTDPTDVRGIKQSREFRLALRQIRIAGEKTRKGLKEDIVRAGKAIDGMNNILLQLIEPEENRLEAQEKIAERMEAERLAKIRGTREAELIGLGENPIFHGQFELMPADEWTRRTDALTAAKMAMEEADRKAKEAEAERIKAEREEAERIRAENARLKAEADARENAMKAEREAAEKARRESEAKAKAERDAIEAKAKAEREAAQAKSESEAKERARLESALKAKEESERAKKEAEATAKQKAERAPEKEKLLAFADAVANLSVPCVKSSDAVAVAENIKEKLVAFSIWIKTQAGKL